MESSSAAQADLGGGSVRIGRWTEESPVGQGKGKRKHDETSFEVEDERLNQDNDIDEILQIPDIDELREEELTTQVAAPPNVTPTHVNTTYKQLDSDLLKHAGLFIMDGEVDLKLLAKVMSPEDEIQEEDKGWEWERLFTEMSSDIEDTWRFEKGVQMMSSGSSSSLPTPRAL